MKKFSTTIFIILIILISIFTGYENPALVEVPKKKVKYILKQLGFKKNFHIKEDKIDKLETSTKKEEFFANSFVLEIEKIRNIKGKTAGIFFDQKNNMVVFTQNGEKIENNKITEINLPIDFTVKREGGVRSVISFNSKYYGLLSRNSFGCNYASLLDVKNQDEIFKTECLPDKEKVDYAGLGGAFAHLNEKLFLSVGTPTHESEIIDALAQDKKSLFGKILVLNLAKDEKNKLEFSIYSHGHRNPQGLVEINGELYSTEHGPHGGDELNLIKQNSNYGWPIVSLGTRYGGKSYEKSSNIFESPIYTFLPAVAPSSLNACPTNLKKYYKNYTCLLGLTLREMSLMIYLLDKDKRLFSVEKIPLDKRLRHFGINEKSKLYVKNNFFYFSSDKDGIYQAIFKDFR